MNISRAIITRNRRRNAAPFRWSSLPESESESETKGTIVERDALKQQQQQRQRSTKYPPATIWLNASVAGDGLGWTGREGSSVGRRTHEYKYNPLSGPGMFWFVYNCPQIHRQTVWIMISFWWSVKDCNREHIISDRPGMEVTSIIFLGQLHAPLSLILSNHICRRSHQS